MPEFINGKTLCASFYKEAARPILKKEFPSLNWSAGLLGYGSDVLGYDDNVSTDHMWGPRFYLFLKEEDLPLTGRIEEALSNGLPPVFRGYSVNFSEPDPNDNGVRHPVFLSKGPVRPLIFLSTLQGFLKGYLGAEDPDALDAFDWLTFSEHRLLAVAMGELFEDNLGLRPLLNGFSHYPLEVRLYLIASQWAAIAEEMAFPKRCGVKGDVLGARLTASRIGERLMRLCFLYANRYAPYSKWFGAAFRELPDGAPVRLALESAFRANDPLEREQSLTLAQSLTAKLHNKSGLTEPVNPTPHPYFGRDIQVVDADGIARVTANRLQTLKRLPLIGTFSEIGGLPQLSDPPRNRSSIKAFLQSLAQV